MGAKENITDINIPVSDKKRFRVNGDNDKIIMLNTSDMGIVSRMEKGLKELKTLSQEVAKSEIKDESELAEFIKITDEKMRSALNGIFDFDVASVCAPSGTMLDVHEGQFMYEHIITSLTGLYENNLAEEYKKMNERINQKTAKYRGKKQ